MMLFRHQIDVFEETPRHDAFRKYFFRNIDSAAGISMLVTKFPQNIRRLWPQVNGVEYIPEAGAMNEWSMYRRENVWLGCRIRNQNEANEQIPELVECCKFVPVIFAYCQPTEEIDLTPWLYDNCCGGVIPHFDPNGEFLGDEICPCNGGPIPKPQLNWIAAGGSEHPAHPDWFRSLQSQSEAAGVPFYFDGWGDWVHDKDSPSPREVMHETPFGPMPKFESRDICVVRRDGKDRVMNANGTFTGESPQQGDAWMVRCGSRSGYTLDGKTYREIPA